MKYSCVSWMFQAWHNPPYEEAIRTVGELGFDAVELILQSPGDVDDYWTSQRIDDIRRLCKSYNMDVSQFVVFQDMVGGLADLDPSHKEEALENFALGCRMAAAFESSIVNIVSPWPAGTTSPHVYLSDYIYINAGGIQAANNFEPKFSLRLADGFDWDAHWTNYVDSIRQCTEIAKTHGLRLSVENHAHVMSGSVDSLLRLMDHVPDASLGVNLDMRWAMTLREDIPWDVLKLKDKLFHTHAGDGDGLACYMLPVGMGNLDWEAIVRALRQIDYQGYFGFEWGGYRDPIKYAKLALEYIRGVDEKVG